MKINSKNKNNTIEKSFIHSKIFQSLGIPDRNKQLKELQTSVINLRKSLVLLNSPKKKNKNKINRKKARKSIFMNNLPKSMMMINNYYKEKQIKRLNSLENFIPQNKLNTETLTVNTPNRDKNTLYMNKAYSLKRKNCDLLQKINKKKEIEDYYNNIFNRNKNDIFMTEANLQDINDINKNNGKNNSLRKQFTENNNYYENTINKLKINKYKSHNLNYNIKDEIMRSSSDKNMLPPIKLRKEQFLKTQKDNQIKNISNKNKLNESLEKNLSTISNITLETKNNIENDSKEDIEIDANKEKINKNLTIEDGNGNYNRKKKIEKLSKQLNTIFGKNNYHNKKEEPKIKDLINKVNEIGKNVKNKRYTYDLEKWLMSSKFKYANWKYGIADINKYFIDMKEFGEQEEKELEMRKSFYENAERVINELKEDKEKRDLINIEHKYGINVKPEEKKIIKKNEYWNEDQANNKRGELCKVLKLTKERKIREKEKRNLVEEIMFQCKKGYYNVINS